MKSSKKTRDRLKRYIERDDFRKLKRMLEDDKDVANSSLNGKGQNALHLSAKYGSYDCLNLLLREGCCDAGARDRKRCFPLHLAARRCLRRFSRSLMLDLVEPLVIETPDLDGADRGGVTCRELLDELRRRQVETLEPGFVSLDDEDGNDDDLEKLEEEREEVLNKREEEREWREKLAAEHGDDCADAFGGSAALFRAAAEEKEERETYDDWAERIYREFSRRRAAAARQASEQAKKKAAPKQQPSSSRPSFPSRPPAKKLRLETPASRLRKKYLAFVDEVLGREGRRDLGCLAAVLAVDAAGSRRGRRLWRRRGGGEERRQVCDPSGAADVAPGQVRAALRRALRRGREGGGARRRRARVAVAAGGGKHRVMETVIIIFKELAICFGLCVKIHLQKIFVLRKFISAI